MKLRSDRLIVLVVSTLAPWAACSIDLTGLEPTATPGSGGGTFASGGGKGTGTGGGTLGGTGGESASGGAPASGGDSGTGGDGSGSGGDTGTGADSGSGGAIGSGGTATGGRAGTGGAASGGRVGTGGAASGGRGTGGTGTGAAATGGRAATGGMPGSGGFMGTGGAVMGKPECVTAADCRLENDCCACRAVPAGAPPSLCPMLCLQTKCAQQELPPGKMDCVAGRCVAGFDCDTSTVVCGQSTPACALGSVPTVAANGNCFSGNCALATQCLRVDSCAACGDANDACVTERPKDGDTSRHCVTIPKVCQDAATCGCFGPSTCVAPDTSCGNLSGVKGVSCSPP